MRNLFITAALSCGLAAFGGCMHDRDHEDHHEGVESRHHHEHEEAQVATEQRMPMSDLPAKVRDGFNRAYPNVRVTKVEKETYKNGTVHYEFEFEQNGKKMDAELDPDGDELPEH
jgi:hypothetical protein